MKNIFKLVTSVVVLLAFGSCKKAADLPFYTAGSKPTLAASATMMAPIAADSTKVGLTLTWTEAKHSVDAANVKYTVEIDSAGKNFSNPFTKIVTGATSTTFTNKDFNTFLINRGYTINSTVSLDVRVTSSFANNNESLSSDVIRIKYTIYKIPPRIAVPASGRLFLVGDASQGGWNNPVPVPSQEFTKIDETTWGGIFRLNGGKQYLMLPVNGDWGNKYAVANNSVAGLSAGGDFGFNLNDNFPGPATSGLYKIIVDFQTGKFSVTQFTQQHGLPAELFIVGDATPGGWNNPVPEPTQKFTRVTSTKFEITLALQAGKNYLLLPENGNWGKKFGRSSATSNTKLAGTFAPEGGDMPSPDVTGTYKITVDFINNTYVLVKI